MATIAEKLTAAIAAQQAEVDRLTQVATVELPAARQKLNQLVALQTNLTAGFETAIGRYHTLGIKLDD